MPTSVVREDGAGGAICGGRGHWYVLMFANVDRGRSDTMEGGVFRIARGLTSTVS